MKHRVRDRTPSMSFAVVIGAVCRSRGLATTGVEAHHASMSQDSGLGKYNIIGFITIVDVPRAKQFYQDILELNLVAEQPPFALVFRRTVSCCAWAWRKSLPCTRIGARLAGAGDCRNRSGLSGSWRQVRALRGNATGRARCLELTYRREGGVVQKSRWESAQHFRTSEMELSGLTPPLRCNLQNLRL